MSVRLPWALRVSTGGRVPVQSGKFCVAYMEVASEKEMYVAAACEEVYLPPSAYISLKGVAVSGTFVRGVLEKAGVEPQIQRIGKYKSAGDQLGRKDMSEAQREVRQASERASERTNGRVGQRRQYMGGLVVGTRRTCAVECGC